MNRLLIYFLLFLLVVLPIPAAFFVFGPWLLVIPVCLLLIYAVFTFAHPKGLAWTAPVLGVLAGVAGVVSAVVALVSYGGLPDYQGRIAFGILALILAIVAGASALQTGKQPPVASMVMLVSGLLGFVAVNLFTINTFYAIAVILWWFAAFIALLQSGKEYSQRIMQN